MSPAWNGTSFDKRVTLMLVEWNIRKHSMNEKQYIPSYFFLALVLRSVEKRHLGRGINSWRQWLGVKKKTAEKSFSSSGQWCWTVGVGGRIQKNVPAKQWHYNDNRITVRTKQKGRKWLWSTLLSKLSGRRLVKESLLKIIVETE